MRYPHKSTPKSFADLLETPEDDEYDTISYYLILPCDFNVISIGYWILILVSGLKFGI